MIFQVSIAQQRVESRFETLMDLQASVAELGEDAILLIDASFTDGGHYAPSHFYGFEAVQHLRTFHHLPNRIVIASPLPADYFSERARAEHRFAAINDPAVIFISGPPVWDAMALAVKGSRPLSSAALTDVRLSLYDLKGFIVNYLTHAWKYGLDEAQLSDALTAVLPYLSSNHQYALLANGLPGKLATATDFGMFYRSRRAALLVIENIIQGYRVEEDENKEQTFLKVLLLEDDPEILVAAKTLLEERFTVLSFTDSSAALAALEADKATEVIGVVCDWRLYHPYSARRQNLQGYDVMKIAAPQGHRAFFALTSLDDWNLVQALRNDLAFLYTFISKDAFLSDAAHRANVLDTIEAQCIGTIGERLPKRGGWQRNGLQDQYLQQRCSASWDVFLHEIAATSEMLWGKLKQALESSGDNDEMPFLPLPALGGPELSRRDLRSVLIHRRCWLALYHYLHQRCLDDAGRGSEELAEKVYRIIRSAGGGQRHEYQNQLSLLTTDLNSIILPEERSWLHSVSS